MAGEIEPERAIPDVEKESKGRGVWKDLDSYFKKGLFILLNIFIVLAAFGLYFSINGIIEMWIEYQYVPVVQSIYYIAVIAISLYLMKIYLLER
jgi:hypothetical protein